MSVTTRMVSITYVESDGAEHVLDVDPGITLMQAALDNMVPGIDADCGGECRCGTCHCYIEEAWLGKLDPCSEDEEAMIDGTIDPRPNSRLSCQIRLTPGLNGLRVILPGR